MFLLIDKPKGITSHDVVDEVRKITGEKRVGHAGTLDPNATGLLIVGVGREYTKKLGKIAKDTRKSYKAEIYLGEERDTDDSEGVLVSKVKGFLPPSENEVRLLLASFLGEQMQVPPAFSALRISRAWPSGISRAWPSGLKEKRAYELARKGIKVKLKPRKITIHSIKLVSYKFPILKIETTVSSGTYVRALARDTGKRLGSGAYLKNLRRRRIGDYSLDQAIRLRSLSKVNWKSKTVNIE